MELGEIVGVVAIVCFLTWWKWSNPRPHNNHRAAPEAFHKTTHPSRHDAMQPATYAASTKNYTSPSTPPTQPPHHISRNFVQTSSPVASAVQIRRPLETPRRTARQLNNEPTPSPHRYNLRSRNPQPVIPRANESPWDDWDESDESSSDTEPVNDELDSGDNDSDYAPSTASRSSTLSRSLSQSISGWTGSLLPMAFTGRLKPYQDEDARTVMRHESEVNARWNAGELPGQLGYILAYMMGLGKTVVSIYLICRSSAESRRRRMPTLAVCPNAALARQWQQETNRFTRNARVLLYHGSEQSFVKTEPAKLRHCDVVLVTYSQLSRQWTKWQLDVAEKKVDSSSVQYPLFCMDWYRIILEESHSIRRWDAKSPGKAVQAVLDLRKMHGLCLSGTPMQNAPADLYSQLRFLGLTFDELSKHNRCQQFADMKHCLLKETFSSHPERFMDILQRTCIHRTEKTPSGQIRVDLPPKKVLHAGVALREDERRLYELVNQLFMHEKVFPRLMRQRQACVLPHLLPKKIEDEQEHDPFNSIRVDQVDDLDVRRASEDMLPGHLNQTGGSTLGTIPPEFEHIVDEAYIPSKISASLRIVAEHTHARSDDKIIIYSWFRGTIYLLHKQLDERGIGHVIFNGETTENQKALALERIEKDPSCRVLLMSIQAGGVGLNITACNVVVFLEPWWNPFVEEQASGRVWRIGQEKPVTIYKLIATDTIEDTRIIQTQELKRHGVESVLRDIQQ